VNPRTNREAGGIPIFALRYWLLNILELTSTRHLMMLHGVLTRELINMGCSLLKSVIYEVPELKIMNCN
jgi:hypothetical protein